MYSLRQIVDSSRQAYGKIAETCLLLGLSEDALECRDDGDGQTPQSYLITAENNFKAKTSSNSCRYCGQIHDSKDVCSGLSRRKFIFLTGMGVIGGIVGANPLVTEFGPIRYGPITPKHIMFADIVAIEMEGILRILPDLFVRDDLFYRTLQQSTENNVTLMDR